MNLSLSEDQLILRDMLTKALARKSTPARIRAAESTGHDPMLWAVFHELGLPMLRAPEGAGGAEGSLLDAVIVAEGLAEGLATIPGVEVMAAAHLLGALGGDAALAELKRLAGGGAPITLALHDVAQQPEQLVNGAAAAEAVIFRRGDEVRLLSVAPGAPDANTGGLPIRRVVFAHEGVLLNRGPDAVATFEAAAEEWKLLTAAAIAASARKALEAAAAYATERHAFGRPIGSFQGLAHPLAEAYAEVEGAALLVWRAAEAVAAGRLDAAALVSMSCWWAAETGVNAVIKAMRAFGGYGMTMEYDAQLYYRRVTAWSLLMGDPAEELQRAGARLWGGAQAALPRTGPVGVSFEFPEAAERAADLAREVFREHITPDRRAWAFESNDGFDPELYRKLAAKQMLYPDWPREFGGGGYDPVAAAVIRGVFVENAWPYIVISVTDMLGRMIIHFGSVRAKREILPGIARGETFGCLCYTEPSCGSDVFAARTAAKRDGDDWLISGQKIFTSQGHLAQYGLMLARTSDTDKHGGLTLFALPLDQPGYRCDPIETVGGERTNTTFYDNVRVPDAYRLGEVNGGARVLAAALTIEQGSGEYYVGALQEMLEPAVEWARSTVRNGRPLIQDPTVLARLAAVATRREVADVLNRRTVWAAAAGKARKHYGPSSKLFGSESWVACSKQLLQLGAPGSLLQADTPLGHVEKQYRRAVPSTIYAGASEVQRSIIAEAGLGMPRSRS